MILLYCCGLIKHACETNFNTKCNCFSRLLYYSGAPRIVMDLFCFSSVGTKQPVPCSSRISSLHKDSWEFNVGVCNLPNVHSYHVQCSHVIKSLNDVISHLPHYWYLSNLISMALLVRHGDISLGVLVLPFWPTLAIWFIHLISFTQANQPWAVWSEHPVDSERRLNSHLYPACPYLLFIIGPPSTLVSCFVFKVMQWCWVVQFNLIQAFVWARAFQDMT